MVMVVMEVVAAAKGKHRYWFNNLKHTDMSHPRSGSRSVAKKVFGMR